MSRLSYTILSGMPTVLDYTSDKVRAAGWYGHTKGLHTVSISTRNFQGRLAIQGSQMVDPKNDCDWFSVPYPDPFTGMSYIQYPRVDFMKRNPNGKGETSTFGFSFRTNCLWLRATICRQYLIPVVYANFGNYTANCSNTISNYMNQNPNHYTDYFNKSLTDNVSWLGAVDQILVNY